MLFNSNLPNLGQTQLEASKGDDMGKKELIQRFLSDKSKANFQYGTMDCCLFVSEWIKTCGGANYAEQYNEYNNKEEADAIIESHGSLEGMFVANFGEPYPVNSSTTGDIALASVAGVEAMGIVVNNKIAFLSPNKLVYARLKPNTKIWKLDDIIAGETQWQ